MKIDGILLDLDNTVYDYKTAHTPALADALVWLSKSLNRRLEEIESAYKSARHHINNHLHGLASSHSRLLYFQGICESFNHWPCELALQAEEIYWNTFIKNMNLREHCLSFLQAMQPRPIAIVTDLTTRIQFEKINKLGLQSYIKAVVTSEEAGHEKPHPHIFELAARKLALPVQSLCMIGDSFERDIEGALAFGMQCFWFQGDEAETDNKKELTRVRPFTDFTDLIKLVNACG